MSTPIWDAIINETFELKRHALTPHAIVLTQDQWDQLRTEWRVGYSTGYVGPGQRRINGLCVAIAGDDYKGPVVLGSHKKD